MLELGTYGSERGARGNSRPYRDQDVLVRSCPHMTDGVEKVVDDLTKPFRLSILGLLAS